MVRSVPFVAVVIHVPDWSHVSVDQLGPDGDNNYIDPVGGTYKSGKLPGPAKKKTGIWLGRSRFSFLFSSTLHSGVSSSFTVGCQPFYPLSEIAALLRSFKKKKGRLALVCLCLARSWQYRFCSTRRLLTFYTPGVYTHPENQYGHAILPSLI